MLLGPFFHEEKISQNKKKNLKFIFLQQHNMIYFEEKQVDNDLEEQVCSPQ